MTTSATSSSSSLFSGKARVTGLGSNGKFDTQSIVEQLMSIERQPYDKLDVKRQTEQLRLQAYQAVNTYLLNFRNSVSTLSSRTLWNAKNTTSTNEKSLTATANQYAVKGSYSFKVAQLATATQYMSKGVADSKAALSPAKKTIDANGNEVAAAAEKLGSITLASAKTRVDNSAKLEDLNGGKGVFRGSIRITDSSNGTANIDLSSCSTLDDVVRTINEATGVRINASMRDGSLYIEDEAGGGSTMKIQNVGAGTTATDLGIAMSSVETTANGVTTKVIAGRNVYTLGRDMSLEMLNDGLGVEEGEFGLRIYGKNTNGDDGYVEVLVDIDDCKTVGDVMDRVNKELETLRASDAPDGVGGGIPSEILKNLNFGVSSDGTSFGFTGVTQDHSFVFLDLNNASMQGQATPATQLGLTGQVWASTAERPREVSFGRVLGDANSPMLKNLGGADGLGVGSYPTSNRIPVAFNSNTPISALNGGKGLDTTTGFQFILLEGGKDVNGIDISTDINIFNDVIDLSDLRTWLDEDADGDASNGIQEHTIGDLTEYLNEAIKEYASHPENKAAGLKGMQITLDENNERLVISGLQPGYSVQIAGGVAGSLGLTRARSGNNIGSAIELDSELDAELREAVDKFYGMGGNNVDLRANGNNGDIVMSGDNATKLGDLGIDWASYFGSGEGITILHDYEDNASYAPIAVTVKWEDLGIQINENTKLGSLVDAMNAKLKTEFAVQDQGNGSNYNGYVPELRLNSLASGLQWSNMDFSGQYWEMADAGTGGGLEAMGLKRTLADTAALTEGTQAASVSSTKLNPRQIGYMESVKIDAETAKTVTVGELNYGVGITLQGEDTDTFEIEFKASTTGEGESYNGKKISFTMGELRTAVEDWCNAWNGDNANAGNPKTSVSQLTLNEYMSVLNNLVDEKIDAYYATKETGVAESDKFSMEFKVSNGTFIVGDLENAESLKISGSTLSDLYGTKTGIAPILYTQKQLAEMESSGTEIVVNYAEKTAGILHPQEVEGLGEIYFTIDGNDDLNAIVKLDTKGLSQDSTLNDLLNHLNDQLAEKAVAAAAAVDPNASIFSEMKFKLNDSGTGIALDNGSNARITFIDTFQVDPDDPDNRISDAQRLGQDLGLVGSNNESKTVEAYSFYNAGSLGRNYISRATSLEDFVGKNAEMGGITVTNAGGNSTTLDLSNAKTVGDIIDAINALKFGVYAQINARGDGIDIIEAYEGEVPDPSERQGNISIADIDGGSSIAKKLGIAGTGDRNDPTYQGQSVFRGSLSTKIDVMSSDSLEDVMYRISAAGYKTAIINDGSGANSYRLTISSSSTGEANDFVIESDVMQLGFNQTSRGKDSKVLYGDPNSSASPIMLSSATNSNSNAILGLTLDIKAASSEWTTITVDDDKEAVTEAVKSLVSSYNELSQIIKYLDAYDQETGEEGILFGDTNVRGLMDQINEFFYDVYNPNNVSIGSVDDEGKQQTWTWMDLGITLSASASNADGTGGWYNQIDLDEDKLADMVASNWDVLSKMLSNEQNVSNVNGNQNIRPTGSFNGDLDGGFTAEGALNGDISKSTFGNGNGIQGADTIENGDNAYTIWFQKATTISRMSIYHTSAETALRDFTVEYLDAATGQWEELRNIEGNVTDANHLGMSIPVSASAVRITGKSTNADDGKFRLLDVQIYEQSGLAGKMNQHTTTVGDTQLGFLAEMNTEIQANLTEIEEQMEALQEKLTAKEESLWRRFTTMETALSKLNSQSTYFSNMMSSINNSGS